MKLIGLENSVKIFLSQIVFLRWLTFLLRSLIVTLTVLLFWIYLFSFLHLPYCGFHFTVGNSDHIVVSVSIGSPSNTNGDVPFHQTAWLFSCWLGWFFLFIWEIFYGRIFLNSAAFRIKIDSWQCRPRCRPTFALGQQNFADPIFKKTSVCEGRSFTHDRDSVILPLVHRFYDTKESFSLLQLPF